MKIIITESQYRILTESKTESMQTLINMALDDMKENCEKNLVNNYACEELEILENVEVVSVEKGVSQGKGNTKLNFLIIGVDVYYNNIKRFVDFDNFIYQLQFEVRQIGGKNIIIHLKNTINTRKDFNW